MQFENPDTETQHQFWDMIREIVFVGECKKRVSFIAFPTREHSQTGFSQRQHILFVCLWNLKIIKYLNININNKK